MHGNSSVRTSQIVEWERDITNGSDNHQMPVIPALGQESIEDLVDQQGPLTELTKLELDVLREVAKGSTNKQIGEELGYSWRTVKNNIQYLLEKLFVENRTQAALLYDRLQILDETLDGGIQNNVKLPMQSVLWCSHLKPHQAMRWSLAYHQELPLLELTEKEIDVLREVAKGSTNKEIVGTLHNTPKIVKRHLYNIFTKLGVHNRTQAALLYDRQYGLDETVDGIIIYHPELNSPTEISLQQLTEKEFSIVREVAKGSTYKEIGKVLYYTPNTLKNCISNIFIKIGVRNRTQAALWYDENHSSGEVTQERMNYNVKGPLPELTKQELFVLRRLAKGDTNKDIGRKLGYSWRTVKHYVSEILEKLGTDNRLQAARWYKNNSTQYEPKQLQLFSLNPV